MPNLIADPSPEDIDAILHFFTAIDAPDFSAGTWAPTEADKLPHFIHSDTLEALIAALFEHHWIYDFDWPAWQPVADRYIQSPALLSDAGLGTLRKIFTTHVRRDRFVEGHLASLTAQGHLKAIFHRLKALREQQA